MNCLSLELISSGERTNARLELCLLNLHIAFLSIENQRHQLDPNDDLLVPPILFGPLLFHTVESAEKKMKTMLATKIDLSIRAFFTKRTSSIAV